MTARHIGIYTCTNGNSLESALRIVFRAGSTMTTFSLESLSFADAELVSFQFLSSERVLRITFLDVYESTTSTFVDGTLVVENWDRYLFSRYRYKQDSWQQFVDDQGDVLWRVARHRVLPTGLLVEGFAKETDDWCTYEFTNATVGWLPSEGKSS